MDEPYVGGSAPVFASPGRMELPIKGVPRHYTVAAGLRKVERMARRNLQVTVPPGRRQGDSLWMQPQPRQARWNDAGA